MSMSHDRIRFFLPNKYSDLQGMTRVMKRAFDMSQHEFDRLRPHGGGRGTGFWLVCRPSQFARFMVYRSEVVGACSSAGIVNGFNELKVSLFTPEPSPCEQDVSMRPHQKCYDG